MTVKGAGAAARQRHAPQHGGARAAHAPACALRCLRWATRCVLCAGDGAAALLDLSG